MVVNKIKVIIMKYSLILLSLLVINISSLYGQTANPDYLDGVIYMKIDGQSTINLIPYTNTDPDFNQIIQDYEITTILNPFAGIGSDTLDLTYKLHFNDTLGVNQLVGAIEALSWVDYCEKAPLYKTTYTPNDVNINQWYLSKIEAFSGWDITQGSSDVVIAIVDNAVRISHTDLIDNVWINPGETENGFDSDLNGYADDINGYDVADNNNNPNPPSSFTSGSFSHGTHCAGTASASTDNGLGVAGVGFNCKIMAVKCTPDNGDGATLPFAYEGLKYAVDAGADIISMSWGSKVTSFTGQALINAANLQGITMFAAAGNDNEDNLLSPASHQNVMAVGATNQSDERASFSNYGEGIAFMAPGVSIYNLLGGNDTDYGFSNGTSMACPIAAGVGGLIKSLHPEFSPADIENAIASNCDNIDDLNPGYENKLGAGRINMGAVFNALNTLEFDQNKLSIKLYPNPASHQVTIVSDNKIDNSYQVKVLDNLGRDVTSNLLIDSKIDSNQIIINQLDHLKKGVYNLKLGESNQTLRFIVN